MVEIIRKGKLPEEKVHETTCDYCDTNFRFTRGEAEYVSDQRDGDYLQIKCPLCHRGVTVGLTDRSNNCGYLDR